MRYQYPVSGPVHVQATLRATDLDVTAGEPDVVTVLLESSRDASEQGAFVANSVVELIGDVLRIDAQLPGFFSRERTRIRLTLPEGSTLDAGTGSGDITATTPLASVVVRTGSGDVQLTDADTVEVTAGSGDVRLGGLRTGRVQTGSGDIWAGQVRESLHVRTGSGDLTITAAAELEAASGSGDITLEELRGRASLRSASGDITVRHAASGELELRSASGDVRVSVASGTAVLLDCSTVSGRMRSGLQSSGEPGPDDARLELRARTTSGDLTISRT